MSSMTEAPVVMIGEGRSEGPLTVHSYADYVSSLVRSLEFRGNPDQLYSAKNFDPKWLQGITLRSDAPRLAASLDVGGRSGAKQSQTIEIHSDDRLPDTVDNVHNPPWGLRFGKERLQLYALTEAKLRYFEEHFGDIPSGRGKTAFSLSAELMNLRSEADYYVKHGSWQKEPVTVQKRAVQVGALGLMIFGLEACGIPFKLPEAQTQIAPPPITSSESVPATEQIPAAKPPVPEKINTNATEATVTRTTDASEIAKEADGFSKSQANWYDQDGNIITKSGSESGLSLLGITEVNAGTQQNVRFGLVSSNGGVEHLVMKTADGQWIMLVANDFTNSFDGHVFQALGVYADGAGKYPAAEHVSGGSLFLPVLSQEFDQSGIFVSGWFFDLASNQFHKMPEVSSGQGKLLAIVERADTAIITGQAQMKTEGVTDWNFKYLADGRLGIVDASGNPLHAWNGSEWVAPRPEYKGVLLYSIDEAEQILIEQGSINPEDRILVKHVVDELATVIVARNPNAVPGGDQWIISYQGIQENRSDKFKLEPFPMTEMWFGNRLMIDEKMIDTTLFGVMATESGHSLIVFKDKTGAVRVLVTDTVFWPTFKDTRPFAP